jgi:hypothetical protein
MTADLPELPPAFITMRRIRQCEDEVAAQLALEHYALAYGAACFRAGMERAAVIATGFATCGRNGKHGRCNEDDPPLAIAAAIRQAAADKAGQVRVVVSAGVPPDEVHLRDAAGKLLGKIVGCTPK